MHALDTAGRAVLFAGTTVVISLLGLLADRTSTFIRGVAVGIAVAVLVTMLASVTLLPALLGFVGRNIDKFGLPAPQARRGRDQRVGLVPLEPRDPAPPVARRASSASSFLLAARAPVALAAARASPTPATDPTSDTTRQAYDLLAEGFGPGFNGPLLLAAETPNGQADLAALERAQRAARTTTPGVAFATPPQRQPDGRRRGASRCSRPPSPQDEATADLVHHLRDDVIPTRRRRPTSTSRSAASPPRPTTSPTTPRDACRIFIGAVLMLSFLLLMVVFRSLLVPLKAVIMNLLSIGAAYGVIVAVFQWGWGASLIGVGKEGPIEAWVPMMMFAIVFGLSMDYEVFLLSRIQEEYDRTGDNATAVADGLARHRPGHHRRRRDHGLRVRQLRARRRRAR